MRLVILRLIAISFALIIAPLCFAANTADKAKEPSYWEIRSVVYATLVARETAAEREHGLIDSLTLRVHATITGEFDPMLQPDPVKVPTRLPLGSGPLAGPDLPPNGSRVLVVLERREGRYVISPLEQADLFPSGLAIEEVGDLLGPKTQEIVNTLREVRTQARIASQNPGESMQRLARQFMRLEEEKKALEKSARERRAAERKSIGEK
jgi:hypothetical protein